MIARKQEWQVTQDTSQKTWADNTVEYGMKQNTINNKTEQALQINAMVPTTCDLNKTINAGLKTEP